MSNRLIPAAINMSIANHKNLNLERQDYLIRSLETINLSLKNGNINSAINFLKQLIEQEDPDIITEVAITNNYLEIAKALLEKGSNPNTIINNQLTPIHTMAIRNNVEGVELLLSFRANPELALESGETPLWTACRHGFNLVAYKLLQAGANPNVVNVEGWTPLMLATYVKNTELALLLLQFNADPNIAKNDGSTPVREKITKFGGQPVWSDSPAWPLSTATGKPMTFICQVKIEKDMFPDATGEMAYIFMTDDDSETYLSEGGENAVIIQPGNIPSFINVNTASTGPTIEQEFNVNLIPVSEPFQSVSECHQFLAAQPEGQQGRYYEMFARTKIGGTPMFIQGEEFPEGEEWMPLLQIESGDVP